MTKKAILVDLDGTLANVDHRVHHVEKDDPDYKAFHDKMGEDKLNQWCAQLISAMQNERYAIHFVTGREEIYREHTEKWLKEHGISFDLLLMRKEGDESTDEDIKESLYNEFIKDQFQVLFVVDDRLSVVKMWRRIGLVCLQCDWGDF